jgi:hypothetical protein
VRNLTEEAKIAPTPRLVGRPVKLQEILCSPRAAITNNGQQNPPNSAAVFVHLEATERAWYISVPNVM